MENKNGEKEIVTASVEATLTALLEGEREIVLKRERNRLFMYKQETSNKINELVFPNKQKEELYR